MLTKMVKMGMMRTSHAGSRVEFVFLAVEGISLGFGFVRGEFTIRANESNRG
jgi:hypothetical protein